MYTYRQIFKQAFKIAWEHPAFWFFGFFLAFVGSAGEIELLLGGYGFSVDGFIISFWEGLFGAGFFSLNTLKGIAGLLAVNPFSVLVFLLLSMVALGLMAVVIWLIIVSQSAVISGAIGASKNKNVSFAEGFFTGLKNFWPVLGLNFVLRIVTWGLFILTALLSILDFPGSALIYIIFFDIFLILTLIASFVVKYAICGVILKNSSFKDSIKQAWQIFRSNWLLSFEIATILFLIYVVTNGLLLFFLPLMLLYALKIFVSFTLGIYLIIFALLVFFIFIEIILAIFHWASWAIVFELITRKENTISSFIKGGFRKIFS
ncbi:hypothetical protein HYZ76_00285 [Candidatus Falkowbacteria bacterium]|nr:hypothetical protein [Candidatus Falkowbacteria bacterium]